MIINYNYSYVILILHNSTGIRDLCLMVKRMTFNHYYKGSNPLGLKLSTRL